MNNRFPLITASSGIHAFEVDRGLKKTWSTPSWGVKKGKRWTSRCDHSDFSRDNIEKHITLNTRENIHYSKASQKLTSSAGTPFVHVVKPQRGS